MQMIGINYLKREICFILLILGGVCCITGLYEVFFASY